MPTSNHVLRPLGEGTKNGGATTHPYALPSGAPTFGATAEKEAFLRRQLKAKVIFQGSEYEAKSQILTLVHILGLTFAAESCHFLVNLRIWILNAVVARI